MPIYHPRIILIPITYQSPFPIPASILTTSLRSLSRNRKHQIGGVKEVAYALWAVGDEGEDLGDEGLLCEGREGGVEFGEARFA